MLEVAHEQSVRRIAADVVERPRGSLFLAVGRSAEVRAAVEAALGERTGITVATALLRDDEGPWGRILAAREQSGSEGEIVLSVAGLGDMAEDKIDKILAHLNLGREIRVQNRLHVLLWVGGFERLDRFRTMAPDLWGHRSGVGLFLSHEDFDVAMEDLGPGDIPRNIETMLREIEEELASSPPPFRMIRLLTDSAYWFQESERLDKARRALEEAERIFLEQPMSPLERTHARSLIVPRKLDQLTTNDLREEALAYATSVEQDAKADPALLYFLKSSMAGMYDDAGRVAESLACRSDALDLVPLLSRKPVGRGGVSLVRRAGLFEQQGALDAAARDSIAAIDVVERARGQSDRDDQVRPLVLLFADIVLTRVSLARGDTLSSLAHAHQGVARMVGLGAKRRVHDVLKPVADIYLRLGLFDRARLFANRAIELLGHSPGEVAWWTRWLAERDADEQNREAAIARYESAVSLYLAAAGTEKRPHLRASWLRDATSVLYMDLARLADPAGCFRKAEELLARAMSEADESGSPEQRVLSRRRNASLARAAKQWDRAETELLAVLAFAEANWGPYKRAEVMLDLARVARERGDLTRAAEHAERAQREVTIDPPEYRNRFTAIDAARELARIRKAQGDLAAAHAALEDALTIARGDSLRLREREVLLDLAELPPRPGSPDERLDHAQRARVIAQDAAFPVDEAEAILVLAELHLDAGRTRRAQSMFDQAIWIVDRIGPRAVRERAARVRAKLGA